MTIHTQINNIIKKNYHTFFSTKVFSTFFSYHSPRHDRFIPDSRNTLYTGFIINECIYYKGYERFIKTLILERPFGLVLII